MVSLALYNIIDTFWVARLGHKAIAALTTVLPYHVLLIAIAVGTGIGISALTSRRFGEKNTEAINHIAGQIFPISGVFGSIFLTVAVFFPHTILNILGATPDIMDYATQYLVIISFGSPILVFSIAANSLLRGSGDALRPMIFMITATVTNMILDPFMIFGIGPFPAMGVRGAALATVISYLLGAGLSSYYIIIARKSAYRIKLRHLKPSLPMLYDIYRVGLPSMTIQIMESVIYALFNNALSTFGSLAIAAAGIGIRVIDLAFMPVLGVSGGLLPIVGFNFGARLRNRLWRAVKLASGGLALFMVIVLVPLEIFTPNLIRIFSNDPEMLAIAVPGMHIMLSTLFITGPSILFITTFQGLSKGREALVLSLIRQLVFFVPLLLLLPRILGIYGIWLSWAISEVLAFFVSGSWLFREYKLQQRTNVWSDIPAPEANSKAKHPS